MVVADDKVHIVARDRADRLGEGLLWSRRDDALYWVDILGQRVNRLTLANGVVRSWTLPDTIGWLVERESGGFVAGLGRRFVALSLEPVRIDDIASPEPERAGNRFNDAKADTAGRVWAGSMPRNCQGASGAFYRLDTDGTAHRVDDGYTIANGPAIGDGFLLHTDTALDTIFRYMVRGDGSLGERRPFIRFEPDWGHPDGMAFDAEGGLWVACWGAGCVARFDPDGRRERTIALPASQISNVAFGGPQLDRMFVTSAADGVSEPYGGALFEVDSGVRGLPPQQYLG